MMAIIWFDIFVLLGSLLQRRFCLFINYNLYPILVLILLSLVRLLAPVETPFTVVIQSWVIFPAVQNVMKTEILGSITVFGAATILCMIIAAVLLVRLFRAYRAEYRVVDACPQTENQRLLEMMEEVVRQTKPGQAYRLCVCDADVVPFICGFRKPSIVLPRSILAMTDDDIRYILAHEWRHYLGNDLWIKLLIEIICCLTWWNPIAYLLKRDIDQTFELKCDLGTIGNLSDVHKLDYLNTLLKLARMQALAEKAQLAAIRFTGSDTVMSANAKQRFRAVIECGKRSRKAEAASIAVLIVLFIGSFGFVIQPYFPPPMEDLTELVNPDKDWTSVVTPTLENAFILQKEDKKYLLYINGEFIRELCQEELSNETHRSLPIIKENKK